MKILLAFQNQSRQLVASPLFSMGVAAAIGGDPGLAAALGPVLAAAAPGPVRPVEDPPALASGLARPAQDTLLELRGLPPAAKATGPTRLLQGTPASKPGLVRPAKFLPV
jgi:hypothetical protein